MTFSKLSWLKHLRGADLNDAEVRVLVVLATYSDRDGGAAFPGNARLADDCGMHARSIRRILHRLVDKGWIVEKMRGGNQNGKGLANVYELSRDPGKGDPVVRKGDPTVPKGDPSIPRKGDQAVPPSGPSHQGIAFRSSHHSAAGASVSPSRATRTSPWGEVPDWEAMRHDCELLEDYLDKQGLIPDAYLSSLAVGMWENGSHPLAIVNTLMTRAS